MPFNTAPPEAPPPAATLLLGGRIRLLQAARGYRAGTDAALLAAAVAELPGERLLEAGCGAGGALLQAAARRPLAALVGVERDAEALALARRNLALNHLQGRCAVVEGDVRAPFAALGLEPFDAAFANPPFFDDAARLRAPAPEKRGAWFADGGLKAWTSFLLSGLRGRGRLVLIHRADRLQDILEALSPAAGAFRVRPVHSFVDEAAKRVLVSAQKHAKGPLELLPPLIMHERGEAGAARFTARAEAVLRGEEGLSGG
jgi:tRNA1(Val) A37 N6-methylase TrmN6